MWPYIGAALVGAIWQRKAIPKTQLKQYTCFGPRTGNNYLVEEMPSMGVIVIHVPGTMALFQKNAREGGFKFMRGHGDENMVALMKKDFSP